MVTVTGWIVQIKFVWVGLYVQVEIVFKYLEGRGNSVNFVQIRHMQRKFFSAGGGLHIVIDYLPGQGFNSFGIFFLLFEGL